MSIDSLITITSGAEALSPLNGKSSPLVAVNAILAAGGLDPVSSVAEEAGHDVTMALQELNNNALRILSVGWDFNTRTITFAPLGANNEIVISSNILQIDPNNLRTERYSVRDGKLFDMGRGTTVGFTSPVELEVVEWVEWCDIPEVYRQYIIRSAAREFCSTYLNDPSATSRAELPLAQALAAVQRHNLRTGNYRVFGARERRVVDRGRPIDRF